MAYRIMYDPAVTGTIQVDNNTGTFYPYKQGSLIPQWNEAATTLRLLLTPGDNVPVMPAIPFGSIYISSTGIGGLALAASYAALVTFVNEFCFLGGGGTISGTVTLGPGEDHIGEVGTSCTVVELVPECLLTAYTAGDVLGTKMTLANAVRISGGTATLTNIEVIDNANQKAPIDVILFSEDPAATYTNQVAFAWDNADMAKSVAHIVITAGMYTTYGNGARATTGLLGNVVKAGAIAPGTSLWAVLVIQGAASYLAINDLTIKLGFYRN